LKDCKKGRIVQPTKQAQFENLPKFYWQDLSQWHLGLFTREGVCGISPSVLLIFPWPHPRKASSKCESQ